MLKTIRFFILLFVFGLLASHHASAAIPTNRTSGDLMNLDLSVFVAGKPINLILVEKDFQRIRVLRHDGRLKVVAEYFAATGENFGPKEREGDSKTPEGIYFIAKKYMDNKVTIFGTRAYHLNYPNIFDSNDGRGGSGIYIHGTNKKLRVNSTNGCITLNNMDLDSLDAFLNIGNTPVIIVSSLLKLETGKGAYPNLTENSYALAKKMLVPEGLQADKFASLYLIRVGGQTVAVGEYLDSQRPNKQELSTAYLDVSPEKGWFVIGRGPSASQDRPISQVADTKPGKKPVGQVYGEVKAQVVPPALDWRNIWTPKDEGVYLDWYRDSLQERGSLEESSVAVALDGNTDYERMIYGVFLLATALSVGTSLFFIRAQMHRMDEIAKEISSEQHQDSIHSYSTSYGDPEKFETLREDMSTTKIKLQQLQEHAREEAQRMGSQDLQARIEELENELADKQAEVEQLITQKSALKLKGMSHLSEQVEELGVMRQELQRAQAELDKGQQDLERVPVLEEMVMTQQTEIKQLLAEKASLKVNASASSDLQEEINDLQSQLSASQEEATSEKLKNEELNTTLADLKGLEEELGKRGEEIERLLVENRSLQENNDHEDHTKTIAELQEQVSSLEDELNQSHVKTEDLYSALSRLPDLKEELDRRAVEIERLVAENQTVKESATQEQALKAANDTLENLNDKIVSLKEALSAEKERSQAMEEDAGLFSGVAGELAEAKAVIWSLREENKYLKKAPPNLELEEELNNLRNKTEALQEALAAEEKRSRAIEEDAGLFSGVAGELAEAKSTIWSLREENDVLRKAKEQDSGDVVDSLNSQLKAAKDELAGFQTESLKTSNSQHSHLKEQLAEQVKKSESLKAEILQLQEGLERENKERQALQNQLVTARESSILLSEAKEELVGLEAELGQKTEEIEQLAAENTKLQERASLGEGTRELDELRSQFAEAQESSELLSEAKEQLIALEDELGQKTEEIEQLAAENKKLQEAASQAEDTSELDDLRDQLVKTQERIHSLSVLKEQKLVLEGEFDQQAEKIEQLVAENVRLQEAADRSEELEELEKLKGQLLESQAELASATKSMAVLAETEAKVHALTTDLAAQGLENERLHSENNRLMELTNQQEDIETLQKELDERTVEIEELQKNKVLLSKAKDRILALEDNIDDHVEQHQKLVAENTKLKEQPDGREEVTALKKELAAAQSKLENTQQDSFLLQEAKDRILALEDSLEERTEQNEKFAAENAILKESSKHQEDEVSEELDKLRRQLEESRVALAESRDSVNLLSEAKMSLLAMEEDLQKTEEHNKQLQGEIQLLQKETADQAGQVDQEELDSLRRQLAESNEELELVRDSGHRLMAARNRLEDIEEKLFQRDQENSRLSKEIASLKSGDSTHQKVEELEGLRDQLAARLKELNSLQESNTQLEEAKTRLRTVEIELGERARENEMLTSELENLKDTLPNEDKSEIIEDLRRQLTSAQAAIEIGKGAGLETSEQGRRIAELEELVMIRQVEIKSLTNQLQKVKENAGADLGNEAAKLNIRLNYVEEDLEREKSLRREAQQQSIEAESDLLSLKEKIELLRDMNQDLQKQLAESVSQSEGVALIKGSHYLPGDVLKKWMNKDSA